MSVWENENKPYQLFPKIHTIIHFWGELLTVEEGVTIITVSITVLHNRGHVFMNVFFCCTSTLHPLSQGRFLPPHKPSTTALHMLLKGSWQ
jgi:hypothetical protein